MGKVLWDFQGGSLARTETQEVSGSMQGEDDASAENAAARYPWFALQVRMRHECNVSDHLQGKGYEWFLRKLTRRCSPAISSAGLILTIVFQL